MGAEAFGDSIDPRIRELEADRDEWRRAALESEDKARAFYQEADRLRTAGDALAATGERHRGSSTPVYWEQFLAALAAWEEAIGINEIRLKHKRGQR